MSGFEFGLPFSFFLLTQLTITSQKFSKCLKNGSDPLRKGKKDTFFFLLCFYASRKITIHVQSNLMECDVIAHCLWFGVVNCGEDALINIYAVRISCRSWTAVSNLRGWRRLARVGCLVKHFLHKQHGVHQWASLHLNWWTILWITATLNDEEVKQSFDRVFTQKVYTN